MRATHTKRRLSASHWNDVALLYDLAAVRIRSCTAHVAVEAVLHVAGDMNMQAHLARKIAQKRREEQDHAR